MCRLKAPLLSLKTVVRIARAVAVAIIESLAFSTGMRPFGIHGQLADGVQPSVDLCTVTYDDKEKTKYIRSLVSRQPRLFSQYRTPAVLYLQMDAYMTRSPIFQRLFKLIPLGAPCSPAFTCPMRHLGRALYQDHILRTPNMRMLANSPRLGLC